MDELFRFVALRPPAPLKHEIVVDGTSPLARNLSDARGNSKGRETMNRLAQSFVHSGEFVADSASLNLPLDQLATVLQESGVSEEGSIGDLVESVLGSSAADVAQTPEFRRDLARLQDSLLALKLSSTGEGAAEVLRLLRAADAVQRIASGAQDYTFTDRLLVRLPASVFPLPTVQPPHPAPLPQPPQPAQEELLTRAGGIDEAIAALTALEQSAETGAKPTARAPAVRPAEPTKGKPKLTASAAPTNQSSSVLLDASAISRLAPSVQKTLADLKIDPAHTTVPAMLFLLKAELGRIESLL